jgi:hypothetical protein
MIDEAATEQSILSAMKPGIVYSPYRLGLILGTHSKLLKVIALKLVDKGKLATVNCHGKMHFIMANTQHLMKTKDSKRTVDPATVALPRTLSPLIGELTGYFAEISRRIDLAMMARPR